MPSAATKRTQAAKKQKQKQVGKAAGPSPTNKVTPKDVVLAPKEATLPKVWPYAKIKEKVILDANGGVDYTLESNYVTSRGQHIRKSLASAFEWNLEELEPNSIYNAAERGNPHHADWLEFNKEGPKVYSESLPLNLTAEQQGKNAAKDADHGRKYVDPYTHKGFKQQSACKFWPHCKKGDACTFYHPPEETPKPRNTNISKSWR